MCGGSLFSGNPLKRMERSLRRDILPYSGGMVGDYFKGAEEEKQLEEAQKKAKKAEKKSKEDASMLYGKDRLSMSQGARSGSLIGGYDATLTPPPGG